MIFGLSLKLLCLVQVRSAAAGVLTPEILILGTGNTVLPVPNHIKTYLNSLGIQLDVQNSVRHSSTDMQRNACSTYNLLSEEGRSVAAAILPSP